MFSPKEKIEEPLHDTLQSYGSINQFEQIYKNKYDNE